MLLSRILVLELARDAVAAGAYCCSGLRPPDDGSPLLERADPLAPALLLLRVLLVRPRDEPPAAEAPAALGESEEGPASAAGGRLPVTCARQDSICSTQGSSSRTLH